MTPLPSLLSSPWPLRAGAPDSRPPSRLRLVGILLLLVCGALISQCPLSASTALPRPSVLLIMPDDVSWDDFSFWRSEGPRTPSIDQLARTGVRLTDFHASPTCSPTRAALLTGRYSNATGVWHTILGRYFLRTDEITIADVFKAGGYRTALFGKWHLGDDFPLRPQDRGFEHAVLFRGGGVDQQHNPWGNRDLAPFTVMDNGQPTVIKENSAFPDPDRAYSTAYFTSQAIDYIRERAAREEPFFAYVAYNTAHVPHDRPPGAREGISDHDAVVEELDRNVGRLLAAIESNGLTRSTLVIFMTDNGAGTRQFRAGKSSPYEGGHRVPCIIRWPAGGLGGTVETSKEMSRLCSHIDVLPTLMDWLRLPDLASRRTPGLAIDGRSLRSLLDADTGNDDPMLIQRTIVVDNQRMDTLRRDRQACVMRDQTDAAGNIRHKWRLVSNRDGNAWELFDVLTDPAQTKNLSGHPNHAQLTQDMLASYDAWWKQVSASSGEYVRPVLGTDRQPSACLYSHDWHTDTIDPPWNHTLVAEGVVSNGFHAVALGRAGTYDFDLRRWPRELEDETSLDSTLGQPLRSARNGAPTMGRALPIRSARLRIWNEERVLFEQSKPCPPHADGARFAVTSLPAGPVYVQTWFYDEKNRELCGAYYVYVDPHPSD